MSLGDDFNGAEIEFTAEVGSIDTGNERRDNHLKSDDFFLTNIFSEQSREIAIGARVWAGFEK